LLLITAAREGLLLHPTINLNGYIGNPTLYVRFRYVATNDRYWAIDNVNVSGTSPLPSCTWTSIPPGFTSTLNNPTGVSETVTTSYIATYVDVSTNCPGSDTVTVELAPVANASIVADYCSVPGKIVLTAYPSGCTYLWSTGESGQSIEVDEVGIYWVTVTNAFGCSVTAFINVANELVTDGSFTNFVPAAPSFFTEYTQNQNYYDPGAPNPALTGLWPEGYYAVNVSAWYNPATQTGYHPNFHGRDHTNNTVPGPRNFMMVNGSTTLINVPPDPPRQRIIWQQTVTVLPNTDYYFSAWGMNLNPVAPAILQFEVNGVLVGSIANLDVAPKPTTEAQVDLTNWVRFYSTPTWNSGTATTAVIRIRNLNTIAGGNDFGLDDISFGTLDPVPVIANPLGNGGNPLCEGDTLFLTANITGGLPPIEFVWTGPAGFYSELQNPIIPNVTLANAGWYHLTVIDGYGCPPVEDSTFLTIIPAPTATLSPSVTVCVNDPEPVVTFTGANGTAPYTFFYTLNAGPVQSITTISGNSVNITVPTNSPGTFIYTLVSVIDQNGCDRAQNDVCTVIVGDIPGCLISGNSQLCPNSTGNIYSGPGGMASYSWSITGNGSIPGPAGGSSVTVTAGSNCNSSFTLTLTVVTGDDCDSTCSMDVLVQDITPPVWTTTAGSLDRTLQCSDAAGLVNAQALAPSASDNCTSPLTPVKTSGNFVPGSCANAGTYTNTWTVSDACANPVAAVFSQIITIIDNTAPVWTTAAGALNVTLECGDAAGLAAAQAMVPAASDNCDPSLVPIKTAGNFVAGLCPNSGTYTNTFVVLDDCGNSSTVYTQVITVNDNTDPDITCPNNVSIDCDESIDPTNTGTATATDNCDPDPAITHSDVIIPGSCPDSYTIQRTWTATDTCGNSISCMQVISVQDVTPPVLVGVPADTTVSCDAIPPAATVTAIDNCDLSVTVNFSQINNVINGCGTITRSWTATDDCLNTADSTQVITVIDTTQPVLIGVPDDDTVSCDAVPVPPVVTVTDNCDPTVSVIFNETINTVVDGCGEIIRTWSATDYCGNTVSDTQTITVEDTEAPVWLTAAGALDVTVQCSDTAGLATAQTLAPVASDNCDPGLTPVKTSGPFVPGSCPQAGTYTNTWIVSDNCGNTSTVYTQVITVIDNTAPVWDQAPNFLNRNLACADVAGLNAALALAPTATDNCGTSTIVMESDVITPGSCTGSYTRTRKWSATDNCGNTNAMQYTQIITVTDNVAPVWDQVAGELDASVSCDDPDGLSAALALTPTATDECGSGVAISLASDDIIPGDCPGAYTRIRTWTAADDCGNINPGVYTQTISVFDDEIPVFYNIPVDVTINCEDPLPDVPDNIIAFDNCSDDVTADIVFDPGTLIPDPNCPNGGTITRTWTVDDGCGNTAFAAQIITIIDTTPPNITCPNDLTVDCSVEDYPPYSSYAEFVAAGGNATDNCDIDEDSFVLLDEQITGGYPAAYSITRIYGISDLCGNQDSCEQIINVPVLLVVEIIPDAPFLCADGSVALDGNPSGGTGDYSHEWSGNGAAFLDQTFIQDPVFSGAPGGSYTLIYTVTDENGCTAADTITVTVNALPVCSILGADTVLASSTGNFYTGPAGMLSYQWSITAGTGTIVGASNAQIVNITAGTGDSFTLSLTISDGTCSNTCEKTVTILPAITKATSVILSPDPVIFPFNEGDYIEVIIYKINGDSTPALTIPNQSHISIKLIKKL
jgi:hypothetical protein